MKLLLDTHILLWAAYQSKSLSTQAKRYISDPQNILYFSAASLWEIAIKRRQRRADFTVDAGALKHGLIENGFLELPITGAHALQVGTLPDVHKDPFDRILVAQCLVETITLLTHDAQVAKYPASIKLV